MTSLQKIAFKDFPVVNFKSIYLIFLTIILSGGFANVSNTYSQSAQNNDQIIGEINFLLPLEVCWKYENSTASILGVASDNERALFLYLLEGKLISINPGNGDKNWETQLGGSILKTPVLDSTNIYVASTPFGTGENQIKIRSLDKASGLTNWEYEITSGDPDVSLNLHDRFLVAVSRNGAIYAFNKADGQIIWSKNLPSQLTAVPSLNNERLLLGFENRVIALSLIDGRIIQDIKITARPTKIFEDSSNILWADKKGLLISLNVKTGNSNWKFRSGAEISHLVLTRKGFLVTSQDNFLYLISEKTGKAIWKKRLSGRISARPGVFGSYVVQTVVDGASAVILELATGKSLNNITLQSKGFFIGSIEKFGRLLVLPTSEGILGVTNTSLCSPDILNL